MIKLGDHFIQSSCSTTDFYIKKVKTSKKKEKTKTSCKKLKELDMPGHIRNRRVS